MQAKPQQIHTVFLNAYYLARRPRISTKWTHFALALKGNSWNILRPKYHNGKDVVNFVSDRNKFSYNKECHEPITTEIQRNAKDCASYSAGHAVVLAF